MQHPRQQQQKKWPACGVRSTTAIESLSVALLGEVLQHVPLQQRMSDCALVSTTWAAAADAATVRVTVKLNPAGVSALQSWLQHNGRQVVALTVGHHFQHPFGQLQLPCAELLQLTRLEVSRHSLALKHEEHDSTCNDTNSSSTAAPRPASVLLPKLRSLSLKGGICRSVTMDITTLLQLTALTALTSLDLHALALPDTAGALASEPSGGE